jgi:hypothetical protein
MTMPNDSNVETETLAETEEYSVWLSHEPDGETVYHFDLGFVTVHFWEEEYEEFKDLIKQLKIH